MALTPETGSIVAGADSYLSVADIKSEALVFGHDLSSVADSDLEVIARRVMRLLNSPDYRWKGSKSDPENQDLPWPRKDVVVDEKEIADDEIPDLLKQALVQLCVDVNAGADLFSSHKHEPGALQERMVGRGAVSRTYDTRYGSQAKTRGIATTTEAQALLDPLLVGGGGGYLELVRV